MFYLVFFFAAAITHYYPVYHSTYYSPFHDYHPVSSFALGLSLGLISNRQNHYDSWGRPYPTYYDSWGRPYPSDVHHHHYSTSNTYNTYNDNGAGTTSSDSGTGSGGGGGAGAGAGAANRPNQNGPNQINNRFNTPQQSAPLVMSVPAQKRDNTTDSSEMIFLNEYLVVGVENLLMYGELLDGKDIRIIIDQDSDGLGPVQLQMISINATDLAINQTSTFNQTVVTNTTQVPLAPLPG